MATIDPSDLLATLRQRVATQVAGGTDPEDAAWDVVCRATGRMSMANLERLVAVTFPTQTLRQVKQEYADAGHESTAAIYQSALMAAMVPRIG